MVIRATTLFNLQCNSVARQVERKCCPYYLAFTDLFVFDTDHLLEYPHKLVLSVVSLMEVQLPRFVSLNLRKVP